MLSIRNKSKSKNAKSPVQVHPNYTGLHIQAVIIKLKCELLEERNPPNVLNSDLAALFLCFLINVLFFYFVGFPFFSFTETSWMN